VSDTTQSGRERLLELLADRATQGLSAEESRELEALLREHPDVDADTLDRVAAAVYLASDAAGFVTGTTLDLNGGRLMR